MNDRQLAEQVCRAYNVPLALVAPDRLLTPAELAHRQAQRAAHARRARTRMRVAAWRAGAFLRRLGGWLEAR